MKNTQRKSEATLFSSSVNSQIMTVKAHQSLTKTFLKQFPVGAPNWTVFWTDSLLRTSVSAEEMETDIAQGLNRSFNRN